MGPVHLDGYPYIVFIIKNLSPFFAPVIPGRFSCRSSIVTRGFQPMLVITRVYIIKALAYSSRKLSLRQEHSL